MRGRTDFQRAQNLRTIGAHLDANGLLTEEDRADLQRAIEVLTQLSGLVRSLGYTDLLREGY